ncbi:hypothetical protein EPH_0037460 [Eimeria praecox]|uniref:Uncharacterized protein n=1 Tax=Eimeria praecox TaxID=51316 RepID=U6GMB8_9EIME|nr:hypothetical protein EPH_0037460 [Eimeria praecox]
MWGAVEASHESPPEGFTGGARNGFALQTADSGSSSSGGSSSSPSRHQASSQPAGSSRLGTAYRCLKQWVETLLVTGLNPTVGHLSRASAASSGAASAAAAAAYPANGSPTASTKSKREGNHVCSDFSRSCCSSATPFSRDVSPDVGRPLRRPQMSSSVGRPREGPPIPALDSLSEKCFLHRAVRSQTGSAYLPSRLPASCARRPEERPSHECSDLCGRHFASKDSSKEHELGCADICPGICPPSSVCTPRDPVLCVAEPAAPSCRADADASNVLPKSVASVACASQPPDGAPLNRRQSRASLRGPCPWGPQTVSAGLEAAPVRKAAFFPFGSSRVRWEDVKAAASSEGPSGAPCGAPSAGAGRTLVVDDAVADGAETCWRGKANRWQRQGLAADTTGPLGPPPCRRTVAGEVTSSGASKGACADLLRGSTRSPRGLQSVEKLLWRMKGNFSSTFR